MKTAEPFSFRVLLAALMSAATPTFGFDVSADGNRDLDTAAATYSDLVADSSAETIVVRTVSGVGIYDWADKDGDGDSNGAGDDASADLTLGNTKIYANNSSDTTRSSLELRLNGGNITGDTTDGRIALSTFVSSMYGGHITITNVGDITIGQIETRSSGGGCMPAGNVTIGGPDNRAGEIKIGGIRADNYSTHGGGSVCIYGSSDVLITNDAGAQGVNVAGSWGGGTSGTHAGDYLIVSHNGEFRASHILSGTLDATEMSFNGDYDGDQIDLKPFTVSSITNASANTGDCDPETIEITGYSGVTVSGSLRMGCEFYSSDAKISIHDIGGDGVSLNTVSTCNNSAYAATPLEISDVAGGGVTITWMTTTPGKGADVTICDVVGNVSVGSITNASSYATSDGQGGDTTICGVLGNVEIGNVISTNARNDADCYAGTLRIGYRTDDTLDPVVGNISITGVIDLDAAYGGSRVGDLKLATFGASATITLAELDFVKVSNVVFSAGSGFSEITGALANFPTGAPLESGLQLAGSTGQKLYYDATLATNAYLGTNQYQVTGGGWVLPKAIATTGEDWISDGTGSMSTDFEDADNWQDSDVPADNLTNDVATFGDKYSPDPDLVDPVLSQSRGVAGVNFTGDDWTLSGNDAYTLTVGQDGIDSAGSANTGINTIEADLSLDAACGAWTIGADNTLCVSSNISGDGSLLKNGTGVLSLSGSNSHASTSISAGTLNAETDNAIGASGGLGVWSGATANLLSATPSIGLFIGDGSVVLGKADPSGNNCTLSIAGDDDNELPFSGVISEASGKTAAIELTTGRQTFSGANTYSGTTTVKGGTMVAGTNVPSGAAGALGNTSSAILVGDTSGSADAALLINGPYTIARDVTVQAGNSGTMTIGAETAHESAFTGAITLNKAATLTSAANGCVTYDGLISGAVELTIDGSGTNLMNNANNSYSGGTEFTGSSVVLIPADIPGAGTNSPLGSGQLEFTGPTTLAPSGAQRTIDRDILLQGTSGANARFGSSYDLIINGLIYRTLTGTTPEWHKVGTGFLRLTNPNSTINHILTVSEGTLQVTADIPASGNSIIGTEVLRVAGGTVAPWGADRVIARNIQLTGTNNCFGDDACNLTLSGTISDTSGEGNNEGWTKIDAATVTVTGANTYGNDGATYTWVNEGTLLVCNTSGSGTGDGDVEVEADARLGGTGTAGDGTETITIKTDAIIAPGSNAVGTLTITDELVLEADAVYEWEFDSSDGDSVITTDLTLGATTTLRISDAGGGVPTGGDYVLIDYSGDDPTLGTWTIDYGTTGWQGAEVVLDTDAKQVILRGLCRAAGTMVFFQ